MTKRELIIAAIVAGVVLVLGFLIEHHLDANRDRELEQLHGIIARDKKARAAAVATTDSVIRKADTVAKQSAHADSGWKRARATAARVPVILAAPAPDTVKIRELVQVIDTLRVAGDSLARAAAADTAAIAQLRVAIGAERRAWSTERDDLNHALKVSEARHRHWGLGATLGPTVMRDPAGVVRAGPIGLSVGLTYRW
jgi:hypothetical protein